MAKKAKKIEDNFVMFDVVYEDGTRSSRRKINAAGLSSDDEFTFVRPQPPPVAETRRAAAGA